MLSSEVQFPGRDRKDSSCSLILNSAWWSSPLFSHPHSCPQEPLEKAGLVPLLLFRATAALADQSELDFPDRWRNSTPLTGCSDKLLTGSLTEAQDQGSKTFENEKGRQLPPGPDLCLEVICFMDPSTPFYYSPRRLMSVSLFKAINYGDGREKYQTNATTSLSIKLPIKWLEVTAARALTHHTYIW